MVCELCTKVMTCGENLTEVARSTLARLFRASVIIRATALSVMAPPCVGGMVIFEVTSTSARFQFRL